jgi:hypothetical protein
VSTGETSARTETAGAGLLATAATRVPDTAATRAGVSRSDAAAAETGWLPRTERDVAAGDRPGAAVRTAAVDLDVAVVPPGAAAALAEIRVEGVSAAAEASSAWAVPAPASASPTPSAPAPSHA